MLSVVHREPQAPQGKFAHVMKVDPPSIANVTKYIFHSLICSQEHSFI